MTFFHKILPYVFIGDDAFPLGPNLIKPYARSRLDGDVVKRVANYRISRARRIIENSFGIMRSRWRIFRCPIHARVETVTEVVKACTALHNFLMRDKDFSRSSYCPHGFVDTDEQLGGWRKVIKDNGCGGMTDCTTIGSNNYSKNAKDIRDKFSQYFNSPEGEVSWQWSMI